MIRVLTRGVQFVSLEDLACFNGAFPTHYGTIAEVHTLGMIHGVVLLMLPTQDISWHSPPISTELSIVSASMIVNQIA